MDMEFSDIPDWESLSDDLKSQLDGAQSVYGKRSSAQDLWELGPSEIDPVLFRLMFLMAEVSDNYNSGGRIERPGEVYNGDLDDFSYLTSMRDELLPYVIQYSTAWIDYFEHNLNQE